MTSKEALDNWYNTESPNTKAYEYELHYRIIKKDLDLLEQYKKFFKYSLTEIQGIKYLTLPNSGDIRRPDTMLRITDEEYELLKRGLEK